MTKVRRIKGRYICRFDFGSASGWFFKAVRHSGKLFSDSKYGNSWRQSARAAIAHRNEILPPDLRMKTVRYYHTEPSIRSTTGLPGIFIAKRKGVYGTLLSVVASYYKEPFEVSRKEMSVKKYGIEKALEMAVEFREEGLNKTVRKAK